MPEGGDRVDHGAAVADRGAKGLRFGQGRELLPRAGGGRAAPGGDKVGGVLQAEFFVRCQPPVSGKLSAALLFLYFSGGRDRTMTWDIHRNARRLC